MLVTQKRPRNLDWRYAGALLFGDWGTSRLYVLGLAFFYTAHATPVYLAAMSVLMAGVAWAYTVICRNFPDGGGVYASARQLSPLLAVVGATLLMCDYIVTVSLSVVEGMHYLGVPRAWTLAAAAGVIGFIAALNWLGSRSAGRVAAVIAIGALCASACIAILSIPFLPAGLRTITLSHAARSPGEAWQSLVHIVLALSGVEAIANMTGVMKEPIRRTAGRAIWVVLLEVVALNLLFGIALSGLPGLADVTTPHHHVYSSPDAVAAAQALGVDPVPPEVREYRDTAVKLLAVEATGRALGAGAAGVAGVIVGIAFGLLLLSAANTAILGMVGVQYAMAQDRELPRIATRLNYSGVPWLPLIIAGLAPIGVLLLTHDVAALAELYAVGVCGAITINVLCAAVNRRLDISRWERRGVWAVGLVMACVEATILVTKPHAALFAGSIIGAVLATRWLVHRRLPHEGEPALEPAHGWIAEVMREPAPIDMSRPRIMLAARGRYQSEFAVDLARRRGAVLFAIYVRTLRVIDMAPGRVPRLEDDPQALQALGTTVVLAREAGVPCVPIYACAADIADEILDHTVTYGCDTLIMGKTRRGLFSRALEGDVVAKVAQHLPEGTALLAREPSPPSAGA